MQVWRAIDADLGVPLVLAAARQAQDDAVVTTNTASVLAARHGIEVSAAAARVGAAVARHLGMACERRWPEHHLVIDLDTSDQWLAPDALAATALGSLRAPQQRPDLRCRGRQIPWREAAEQVGDDALAWAALRSARRAAPLVITPDLAVLATRRDANPLALVRRAHAACVLRRRAGSDPGAQHEEGQSAGQLRVALLLASRAGHDAERSARTSPVVLAVENVATQALRHLERTPVTRTDRPAVEAARKILCGALDAVGVTAPVPY